MISEGNEILGPSGPPRGGPGGGVLCKKKASLLRAATPKQNLLGGFSILNDATMDVTIPPHNLRRFASSVSCLGRIGKDLYVSFDPLDGLTLSSLNEAKSAYGKFHFDPGFFERCDGPHREAPKRDGGGGGGGGGGGLPSSGDDDDDDDDGGGGGSSRGGRADDDSSRYVCRVPVRSVHSVLRPRKGVLSLRVRSEGADDDGNHFGMRRSSPSARTTGGGGGGGRSRSRGRRRRADEGDDDEDGGGRRRGRRAGSYSARERSRSRGSRRRNGRDEDEDDDGGGGDGPPTDATNPRNSDKMTLSFEFHIDTSLSSSSSTSRKNDNNGGGGANDNNYYYNANSNNNGGGGGGGGGGAFRVVHKVGVTDANGIALSASAARRRTRSEIVSHPRLWLRLLDPLRRAAEVALTIDDALRVVTATSFHPGEVGCGAIGGVGGEDGAGGNAVLLAAAARNAVLKTETSTGAEEFDEYDFRSNRGKKKRGRRRGGGGTRRRGGEDESEDTGSNDERDERGDDHEGGEGGDDCDYEKESDRPPSDVNQKVILVFSIKEAKVRIRNVICSASRASPFSPSSPPTSLFRKCARK